MNDMPKHDDDPRAPYKVYEGEELKGTYPTALKHGGRNSNSKARPPIQNRNVIHHQGRSGARRYMTARLDLTLPRRGRELIINGHPNSRVDQSAGSEVFRVPSAQIAVAHTAQIDLRFGDLAREF